MKKIQNPTVFIVDDDAELCNAVTWLLQSVNIYVEVYANGQAYLDAYDANRRGCLLVDIQMPIMSGYELLTELNKKIIAFLLSLLQAMEMVLWLYMRCNEMQ